MERKGALDTRIMNFRMEPEYKQKMQELGEYYGTGSMTKVLKKVISDAYDAQIINPQQTTKEG